MPPALNASIMEILTDRSLFFKNRSGDIYDTLTLPTSYSTSSHDLVILGGIDKRRAPEVDYFGIYMSTNKKFMTWAPRSRDIDRNQEDYLQFFVYDASISIVNKLIKAYYDDDTTETDIIESTDDLIVYGNLYRIPTGPTHSGALAINPAKNLTKYEVWLTDQSDVVISEVMVYNVTSFTKPNTRYILFINSLGADEVIRLTGETSEENKISKAIVQKHLPMDYQQLDGQFHSSNTSKQSITAYSSGYFSGKYGEYYAEYLH